MQIIPFDESHIPAAANMLHDNIQDLGRGVPGLPRGLENTEKMKSLLGSVLKRSAGLAAVQGETTLGFLTWWIVDDFRYTGRRAAYCPVWGHAVAGESRPIYQSLYRAAGQIWTREGCHTHALTILANQSPVVQTWFWSGFGLTGVDAARPMEPLRRAADAQIDIHTAGEADIERVYKLNLEHRQHYRRSPVFMAPYPEWTRADIAGFLSRPGNTIWMAIDGSSLVGFLVFDRGGGEDFNFFKSGASVHITGAYIRPEYRRRGVATRILERALRHYATEGLESMTVDFEAYNPEASGFWMQHFQATAYSLIRVPENALLGGE